MRYLGVVSAAALSLAALASPALAQQSGSPMADLLDKARLANRGPLLQWSATRPSALAGLSRSSRDWIKAEVQRQAQSPRTPLEVALEVDAALKKDIHRMAKDKRVHDDDVSGAILIKLMKDTELALKVQAMRAGQAEQQQWASRIDAARSNVRTAIEMQSDVSLALATD